MNDTLMINALKDIPHLTYTMIVGLSLALVLTLSQGLQMWVSDWKLIHHTIAPQIITANQHAALTKQAISAHVFGQTLTEDGEVPITSLALRVTGISKIVNETGRDVSHVSIAIDGGEDKLYQVGDALPDGVKIYRIENNAVILEHEGRLEKLPLLRSTLTFLPPPIPGSLT